MFQWYEWRWLVVCHFFASSYIICAPARDNNNKERNMYPNPPPLPPPKKDFQDREENIDSDVTPMTNTDYEEGSHGARGRGHLQHVRSLAEGSSVKRGSEWEGAAQSGEAVDNNAMLPIVVTVQARRAGKVKTIYFSYTYMLAREGGGELIILPSVVI